MTIPRAVYDEIETLVNTGEFEKAYAVLEPYIKQYPDNFDVLHNEGVIFTHQGRLNDALEAFQKSYDIDQFNENHLYNYAACLYACGRPEESLTMLRRVAALNPNKSRALKTAADVCYCIKKYVDAASYLKRYMNLLPHEKTKETPYYIHCLQHAEAHEPDNIDVKLDLYEALMEKAHAPT